MAPRGDNHVGAAGQQQNGRQQKVLHGQSPNWLTVARLPQPARER
jgi:hypothetical protein